MDRIDYLPTTTRVTCGPDESVLDVARQQWGDEVRVVDSRSAQEREELEHDGYRPVGSVSVRSSQPDHTVLAPWSADEICPECGGRVLAVDCPAEQDALPDGAQSYCRRCGQRWDTDGEPMAGTCPTCDGEGVVPPTDPYEAGPDRCPDCGGIGIR